MSEEYPDWQDGAESGQERRKRLLDLARRAGERPGLGRRRFFGLERRVFGIRQEELRRELSADQAGRVGGRFSGGVIFPTGAR